MQDRQPWQYSKRLQSIAINHNGARHPTPHHTKQTKRMTIEITKEAALQLIGNDELTCIDYKQDELAETSFYCGFGVNIQVIYNWVTRATQYYVTDINA